MQQERDRRVDAEQELQDREADRRDARSPRRRRRPARARAPGRAARAGARRRSRRRRSTSEVRPSVWASSVSMNRPRPKPKHAPAIEPHSSPTVATSSGERSAGTPKTATCETVVSCRMPPTSPIATRRPTLVAFQVTASRPRRAGRRSASVSTCTKSRSRRSANGLDVDRAVELALALDPLDRRRSGCPRGNGDGSRVGDRAGRDDRVAGAHLLGLGHEVEQQVAGRAGDRQDRARLPGPRGAAPRRRSRSRSAASRPRCRRRPS